jgi:hypothetical protein
MALAQHGFAFVIIGRDDSDAQRDDPSLGKAPCAFEPKPKLDQRDAMINEGPHRQRPSCPCDRGQGDQPV